MTYRDWNATGLVQPHPYQVRLVYTRVGYTRYLWMGMSMANFKAAIYAYTTYTCCYCNWVCWPLLLPRRQRHVHSMGANSGLSQPTVAGLYAVRLQLESKNFAYYLHLALSWLEKYSGLYNGLLYRLKLNWWQVYLLSDLGHKLSVGTFHYED